MNLAIVVGSLADVAQKSQTSISESFLNADVIVLIDVSSSMEMDDARNHRTRYAVACEELANLQRAFPGKIAVVSFSHRVQFCPGGVPVFLGGNTDLTLALQFVKVADGTVDFIIISDGEPDSPTSALEVAKTFQSRISCVYVGPEGGPGSTFLGDLARIAGGRKTTADRAADLAKKIETLMLRAG